MALRHIAATVLATALIAAPVSASAETHKVVVPTIGQDAPSIVVKSLANDVVEVHKKVAKAKHNRKVVKKVSKKLAQIRRDLKLSAKKGGRAYGGPKTDVIVIGGGLFVADMANATEKIREVKVRGTKRPVRTVKVTTFQILPLKQPTAPIEPVLTR